MAPMVPVPIFWRASSTRSFAEVPLATGPSGVRFRAIELQQVLVRGIEGHVVLLHLPGGEIECYAEKELGVDDTWFRAEPPFAHFALDAFESIVFDDVRCHVSGGEVDAVARFTDRLGDQISLRLHHRSTRRSKPLFTPAPVHENPENLRFLLVNDFRYLPSRRSEVDVRVNDHEAIPAPLLLPSNRLAPLLGARGATDLLMVGLLPAHDRLRLTTARRGRTVVDDGTVVDVSATGLRSVEISNPAGSFAVRVHPPLPDLTGETEGVQQGRIMVTSPLGPVATGRWRTTPTADHGHRLELIDVAQDWWPGVTQPSRLLLRQARAHRRRTQRWNYRATVERDTDGHWYSTGSWSN